MSGPAATLTVDDTRHSVLSRARAPGQTYIDSYATGTLSLDALIPRDSYGDVEIKEIESKSALTWMGDPFDQWGLNPYMGCSHACAYCYVPDVAHLERPRWGSYVVVKRNLPTILAHELRTKARHAVFLSSATDPYQAAEREHGITRKCLEQLLRADWPLRVLTRSPLVRRDTDLFSSFTDVSVGMSVPTLDDGARAVIEPRAPPIEGRLRALRSLADAGLDTYANLMPLYPLTGGITPGRVATAFEEAGVRRVYAGGWNYLAGVLPVLRERVAGTAYEDLWRRVVDPGERATLLDDLRRAFERTSVVFKG